MNIFLNKYFIYFINRKISFAGNIYQSIITSNVLNFGKSHFNCNSLEGLPLENDNSLDSLIVSVGSHWEKTIF